MFFSMSSKNTQICRNKEEWQVWMKVNGPLEFEGLIFIIKIVWNLVSHY